MIGSAVARLRGELGRTRLLAVSKTRSADEVREAFEAGQRAFGENHVQEIREKFDPAANPLAAGGQVSCEMIGHLQTNKVRQAVRLCSRIDSVDSLRLARAIDAEARAQGKVMPVLVELNTCGEESKSGIPTEEEAREAVQAIALLPNLRLEGFMTIGPVECMGDKAVWERKTRDCFARLRAFRDEMRSRYPQLDLFELSMGMSADWRIAVEEGSTQVRLGTAVFGERRR